MSTCRTCNGTISSPYRSLIMGTMYRTCEKCRSKERDRKRNLKRQRIANHLCTNCGKQLDNEFQKVCSSCSEKLDYRKQSHKLACLEYNNKFRDVLSMKRLCLYCYKRNVEGGHTLCNSCLELKHNAYMHMQYKPKISIKRMNAFKAGSVLFSKNQLNAIKNHKGFNYNPYAFDINLIDKKQIIVSIDKTQNNNIVINTEKLRLTFELTTYWYRQIPSWRHHGPRSSKPTSYQYYELKSVEEA